MCTLDFFFLMNVLFLETLFIFYLKKNERNKQPGMVPHTCNPNFQKPKTKETASLQDVSKNITKAKAESMVAS